MQALGKLDNNDWEKIEEVRFFGGGPLEPRIKEFAYALAREKRPFTMGGYLDKGQAVELLQWCDYVLIPSRIESIPIIFSDAMQMSKPVLASPVGDLPRLVADYQCGFLASEVSTESFVEIIRSALVTPRNAFQAGIARARSDFDLPNIVRHFLEQTD